MAHAVRVPPPPLPILGGHLRLQALPAAQDNLIWLLSCPEAGEAVAIDGPGAGPVLEACEAQQLQLIGLLTTHTHHDHIGLHRDLERRGLLEGLEVWGAAAREGEIPGLSQPLRDGARFTLWGAEVQVLETPGHIDDHLCYLVGGEALFCGDTLFAGGCGYLFDGPASAMWSSLRRLRDLPGDPLVCCAHEYTEDNLRFAAWLEPDHAPLQERVAQVAALRAEGRCTLPPRLSAERSTNPFLRSEEPALRAAVQRHSELAASSPAAEVFAAARALKDSKRYKH